MSVNFSSFTLDSDLYLEVSSRNVSLPLFLSCFVLSSNVFIFAAFTIISVLLFLPLSMFIFYIGLQQCQHRCSTSSTTTVRHSDVFIYNMVIIELIGVIGSVLCSFGLYSNRLSILNVGCLFFSFSWYGQAISHILTSVERYLATVHPIAYLSLRTERGERLRNISIVSNWLLGFVGMGFVMIDNLFIIMDFALLVVSFSLIFFCSLSVLCVLIPPGPGSQGGDRRKVDHIKRKALVSTLITLGVLLFRFLWNLTFVGTILSGNNGCLIFMFSCFSSLPSSLILPLMFLHREGKLKCCNKNIQSG